MQKLIARNHHRNRNEWRHPLFKQFRSASPRQRCPKIGTVRRSRVLRLAGCSFKPLEAHVGANSPEEAITIAAEKLPENIVFAKATGAAIMSQLPSSTFTGGRVILAAVFALIVTLVTGAAAMAVQAIDLNLSFRNNDQ